MSAVDLAMVMAVRKQICDEVQSSAVLSAHSGAGVRAERLGVL
jgi:hypothetical protein